MQRPLRTALITLACALFLVTGSAEAAPTSNGAAVAAPTLVATIHAGSLTAYKYGSGKKALILLPGLASGAYVWDSTVAALQSKYTIYTVTFAGFDGMPATAKAPYLDAFTSSVEQLVRDQHLNKPIIVGHSLGGDVALRVGADASPMLAGVVVVDALPVFPPLQPGETMDSRKASTKRITDQMTAANDEQFAAGEKQSVAAMVTSPQAADEITQRSLRSDRATVVGSFGELATTDLTPQLGKITVPVLVLAASSQYTPEQTQQFYAQQYGNAKNITVKPIANSRHFIMYDQPAAFQAALSAFVDGLP